MVLQNKSTKSSLLVIQEQEKHPFSGDISRIKPHSSSLSPPSISGTKLCNFMINKSFFVFGILLDKRSLDQLQPLTLNLAMELFLPLILATIKHGKISKMFGMTWLLKEYPMPASCFQELNLTYRQLLTLKKYKIGLTKKTFSLLKQVPLQDKTLTKYSSLLQH